MRDNLFELQIKGQFDTFFNIILNINYFMNDLKLSKVEAAEQIEKVINKFNLILRNDKFYFVKKTDGDFMLVKEDEDLIFIDDGGFANVYRQKSTGLVIKKLKDESLNHEAIRSRFKREFEITRSLADLQGIIKVYSFYESECSYTMEFAGIRYDKYIKQTNIDIEIKINLLIEILRIIDNVHKRGIIHRDLSPNNIFVNQGKIIITDFGLGKNTNLIHSHQTLDTNNYGQFYYCAPEQYSQLVNSDMRSDVFSLGRIINYTMALNPRDSQHQFKNIADKATNDTPQYRHQDASALLLDFKQSIVFFTRENKEEEFKDKMCDRECDDEMVLYLYKKDSEELCRLLASSTQGAPECFILFMQCSPNHARHMIQSINSEYQNICTGWAAYDPFAKFAYQVLLEDFEFTVHEIAANMLYYVARSVNRYSAQDLVEKLRGSKLTPAIKSILFE